MQPLDILRERYGYDAFRPPQDTIISRVIAGQHACVIMPTGGGKSLCYQIPALCREGVGIVVSPLIALMQDQVAALHQLDIRAAAIHSGLEPAEREASLRALREGNIDILYVAPERLVMPEFMSMLKHCNIALFAIDEAHCMSQWGHDFRPDYAALSQLVEAFPNVPRIALTATADAPTRRDICRQLAIEEDATFICGFDRPNIHYSIAPRAAVKQRIVELLRETHAGQSGIIYCMSRKKVEELTDWLKAQGVHALAYHAGMDASARAKNQERFLRDEAVVMVATIAFGMGIDKPDVRFVMHTQIPKNIEAYYQETGRAGRDGMPARAYLWYGMDDVVQLRRWIDESDAGDAQKRIEHQKLQSLIGLCETAQCRRQVLLRYFDQHSQACGHCDTCDQPPEGFDATIAAQKLLSCVYRSGQRFGLHYIVELLTGSQSEKILARRHDQLSTYGIGEEYSRQEWLQIGRQLVTLGLLHVDAQGHGGLALSEQGTAFLREKQPLQLRKQATRKPRASRSASVAEHLPDAARGLFATLKHRRAELAKTHNVPAYVIFHDKTLEEMARQRPQEREAMLAISGIGATKYERYGEAFLEILKSDAA